MALTPTQPALELRGVSKNFGGFQAVRDFDLSVPRGTTYGVLGPNGAGKTTAIRMALRIIEPDAGTISILGEPLSQHGLDRVGYLPEERGVYKRMKVKDLLAFMAELKGVSRRAAKPQIERWLERLDLTDWADKKVQELSKGMQQKIQFVGAMLHDPEIVILDEPFSGLDPINQQVLREIIVELKRADKTIVFSTHIIEHAERICDHVCIIAHGRKVADGAVPALKQEHGGDYVAIGFERPDTDGERLLRGLPIVVRVRQHGTAAEVALRDGADPQELLVHLINQGVRLRRFECTEPSLEEIFLECVGAAEPRPQVGEREVAHV
ncbi:MAG: ABC transporter ATP-binding protein [Longimicrobiales bacterium]